MADEGEVRWNPQTQRWDTGAPQGRYTPPPPPRPAFEPTSAPVPGHEPASGPGGPGPAGEGPNRAVRKVVAVLTAAVLVGAGAGFGGWYLWGRDGDGTRRDGTRPEASTVSGATGASPSESASGSDSGAKETVRGTASPSPSQPPPGYRNVSEGDFDIAVPEDWKRRTETSDQGVTLYYYEKPGAGPRRYVEVFKVTEPGATPRGTLKAAEKDLKTLVGNYRRLSLDDVPDDRGEAAELDYAHHNKQWDTEMRTVYRVIHGDETQLYAVLTSGPAEEWTTELRQVLETASDSFCLDGPDGACGGR